MRAEGNRGLGGDENVLKLFVGVVAQICEYPESAELYFKWLRCQLVLKKAVEETVAVGTELR